MRATLLFSLALAFSSHFRGSALARDSAQQAAQSALELLQNSTTVVTVGEPCGPNRTEPCGPDRSAPVAAVNGTTAPVALTAAEKEAASADHKKTVMDQLEKLAEHLQDNEKKIAAMDKKDQADHEKGTADNITKTMSPADAAMWANFNEFNHRMNEKTKVHSLDVISKIKHAVHFIKKGGMGDDADAAKGLQDVIASMGEMSGNFLH